MSGTNPFPSLSISPCVHHALPRGLPSSLHKWRDECT